MSIRSAPILVIANSARMLSQVLYKNQYQVVAIDCYCDTDTQTASKATFCVEKLEGNSFCDLLIQVRDHFGIRCAIYGSGLEHHRKSLYFLEQNFVVIGCTVEVFGFLQNKPAFFHFLNHHNIPFPKVCFTDHKPNQLGLYKPYKSLGGQGVVFDVSEPTPIKDTYWQEYIEGMACSVLFVANETNHHVVGYNRQLCRTVNDQPFVFSGLIAQIELKPDIRQKISLYLNILVQGLKLKGLCGLDFILAGEQIYLLEINPRLPASVQLYSTELIQWHIDSCLSADLPVYLPTCQQKALQIVYSDSNMTIPSHINWPEWVHDKPKAGSQISKNQPICSIIVSYRRFEDVERLLNHYELIVKNLLLSG